MRAVDVKSGEALGVTPSSHAAATGEASVGELDDRRRPVRGCGWSKKDALSRGPHHPQIAPGVDASLRHTERIQALDRSVDGVAFRDPTQIDPDRPVKSHTITVE